MLIIFVAGHQDTLAERSINTVLPNGYNESAPGFIIFPVVKLFFMDVNVELLYPLLQLILRVMDCLVVDAGANFFQ